MRARDYVNAAARLEKAAGALARALIELRYPEGQTCPDEDESAAMVLDDAFAAAAELSRGAGDLSRNAKIDSNDAEQEAVQ